MKEESNTLERNVPICDVGQFSHSGLVSLGFSKPFREAINHAKLSVCKIFTQVITFHTHLILCLHFLHQICISYKLIHTVWVFFPPSPSTMLYPTLPPHGQSSYKPRVPKTHLLSLAPSRPEDGP